MGVSHFKVSASFQEKRIALFFALRYKVANLFKNNSISKAPLFSANFTRSHLEEKPVCFGF